MMAEDALPEPSVTPALLHAMLDSAGAVSGSSRIDLNLLIVLDALLRERHVTKAAEQVGITQPAMSRALRRLRLLFRDELLVRVAGTYYLTSFAQELVNPLSQILSLIDWTLERRATFDPQIDHGRFSIATTDYISLVLLRSLVAELHECAPKLSVTIRAVSSQTIDDVVSGELDLTILPTTWETSLPREEILVDRWVCATDATAFRKNALSLEDYKSMPQVRFAPVQGAALNQVAAEPEALRSEVSVGIESFLLLPFFLRGTKLKCLIPERVGKALQGSLAINLLELPFEMPRISEAMFWHPRTNSNPMHLWMRDKLRTAARSL